MALLSPAHRSPLAEAAPGTLLSKSCVLTSPLYNWRLLLHTKKTCKLQEQVCSSSAWFSSADFLQTHNCFSLLIACSSTSLPVWGIQACVISKLVSVGSLALSISATATSSPSQELLKSIGESGAKGGVDAASSASEQEELRCL